MLPDYCGGGTLVTITTEAHQRLIREGEVLRVIRDLDPDLVYAVETELDAEKDPRQLELGL